MALYMPKKKKDTCNFYQGYRTRNVNSTMKFKLKVKGNVLDTPITITGQRVVPVLSGWGVGMRG